MEKTVTALGITIVAVATLHAFRSMQPSGISGNVDHPDKVAGIYAVNSKDSIRIRPDKRGTFVINSDSGSWKIIVRAKYPYKDVIVDKIEVKNGQITQLGEITLHQ